MTARSLFSLGQQPMLRFDQYPTHCFRSRSEEVTAGVPLRLILAAEQSQIRFLNQRHCLQRLSWCFVCQLRCGQCAQLSVHQRKKLFGRGRFALLNLCEKPCDVSRGNDRLSYSLFRPVSEQRPVLQPAFHLSHSLAGRSFLFWSSLVTAGLKHAR